MTFVCVVGMHCSGTSLIAGVLQRLGVDTGPDDTLTRATVHNQRGHDESSPISGFNDELLRALGGDWRRPPLVKAGWELAPELDAWRMRARELLVDQFSGHIFAWKDPRGSLLLPFWKTVTQIDRTILVVRDPSEVAASIHRRDGLDEAIASELWLDYNAAAWLDAPRPLVVNYEQFLRDAKAVSDHVADELGLPQEEAAASEVAELTDTALRHHQSRTATTPQCGLATVIFQLIQDDRTAELTAFYQWWRASRLEQGTQRLTETANGAALRRQLRNVKEQLRVAEQQLAGRQQELRVITQGKDAISRRAERAEDELSRLRARRSVRLALGAAQPLTPIVRRLRELRGARTSQPGGASVARRMRATEQEAAELTVRLQGSLGGPVINEGPTVSVVILNRNGVHHLQRLLPGLATTSYPIKEVIVVDNGSDDGSLELLSEWTRELPLEVIGNSENLSFSEGNNQGIAQSTGELVLILNNDIEPVTPHWLGHMVNTLQTHDASAVGARLIYPRRPGLDNAGDVEFPDLTLQHRGVHFTGGAGVPLARNLGNGDDPQNADAIAVRRAAALTAACLLIRRDHLDEVDGFSDSYLYGTEDVDLCLKLRRLGRTLMYDGQAVLWHHEYGTQNTEGRERKRLNRLHNRQELLDRWGPQLFRQVFIDRLMGCGEWSDDPLHVALTLTRDDPEAGWGDWYTAHELGAALEAKGFRVSYAERYADRWYQLGEDVDVVIALLDALDIHRLPDHVVTVAWVRNWTDRWLEHGWFDDFDLVFASSGRTKELIDTGSSQVAVLMPLATNPERFVPQPATLSSTDVLFVGNYWEQPRAVISGLPALDKSVRVALYGKNWHKSSQLAPYSRGPLPYELLPEAYGSTAIVLDDTAEPTKPYGAVNGRVFDALACGALVLSDNPVGIREVFDDDFPVWEDAADLRRQVESLLNDPDRRRALAERYRHTVLEHHTYAHRAEQIREALLQWATAERVGIAVGVPDRAQSESWGDYHYARAVQRQLRRSGHPARIHLLPSWAGDTMAADDIIVHLCGLSDLQTRPSQLNVLWSISHPDRVDAGMCRRYDIVLTASETFADVVRGLTAVPVHALHQATDPVRFRPEGDGPHHQLLFVGNSRKTRRRILDDLLPTTHELAVYGRDWTRDLVDRRHVRGELVPNRDLHRYYAAADIVLNDHWDDMREHGYLSNRLYDALAAGAFVVSDHVPGIEEEFDGGVVAYRDRDDLHEKINRYLTDPEARSEIAARGRAAVIARHTFEARITELLAILQPALVGRARTVTAVTQSQASKETIAHRSPS